MRRSLVLLLTAALGAPACSSDDADGLGQVDLSLVGQAPSGTTYRLRDAVLTIDGPGGARVFHTEDDPGRTQINARLQSGAYTLQVAPGWRLEKLVGTATQPVQAALLSPQPLGFPIAAGEFTPVTLRFRAGADEVSLGEGDVGISIGVEEEIDAGPPAPQEIVTTVSALSVPEGGTAVIGVRLSQPITSAVTVTVTASEVAVAPQTLTFTPADFGVEQTIAVTAPQDVDVSDEAGAIHLSLPGVASRVVDVAIDDDDPLLIQTSVDHMFLREDGSGTFQVRLSARPGAPVTVTIADDPAYATVSPNALTFTPDDWDRFQAVEVSGVADDNTMDAVLPLFLSGDGIATATIVHVNIDDDDAQSVIATPPTLSIREGTSQTAQVRLAFRPFGTVEVAIASSDSTRVVATPATLSFDAENWSTPQTVTIAAAADLDQLNQAARVALTAAGISGAIIDVTAVDTTIVQPVGWTSTSGIVSQLPSHELRLFRVQLARSGALDRLETYARDSRFSSVRFAVYEDAGGFPGRLVFGSTSQSFADSGLPTRQPGNGVILPGGSYFIGMVTSAMALIQTPLDPLPTVLRCIQPMAFSDPFPAIAPARCANATPLIVSAWVAQ